MKKYNQILLALFVGISLFGSMNALSMNADQAPVTQEAEDAPIKVTVINRTKNVVNLMEATPIADWRWLSKACQWMSSAWCGTVVTLAPKEEVIITMSRKSDLAFYCQDLSRTISNVKQSVVLATSATATLVGAVHLEPASTAAGAYKTKTAYDGLCRPGERIHGKDLISGSTITLKTPKVKKSEESDSETEEADAKEPDYSAFKFIIETPKNN